MSTETDGMGRQQSKVKPGSRVTLYFSLALENGAVIDSNFESEPATFVVGDGNLLPGFEEALAGLEAGQSIDVLLSPEQGFGAKNPDNVQVIPKYRFSTLLSNNSQPVEVGTMLSFADGGGNQIPGVVREINDETFVMDFNHPLAGRNIRFAAEIVAVVPADVQTVEVK